MLNPEKILYVDDEEINLYLFKHIFRNKYPVITCSSPLEALEILHENTDIGIVISDMSMPKMNGVEFIEKACKTYPERLYYILTAYEINEEIDKSIENRTVRKCFQKPLNVKEISEEISSALIASYPKDLLSEK